MFYCKPSVVISTLLISLIGWCGAAKAQLLPNNSNLNVQSVQRWMDSNRNFSKIIQAVDAMFVTEEALAAFDLLPSNEQDKKINNFLQQQKMLETAQALSYRHGWKSVGEYRRLSTRLGNAIAAYFLAEKMAHLTRDEQKTLREKSDPAIVAVSDAEISFVTANEKLLKIYIQSYADKQ